MTRHDVCAYTLVQNHDRDIVPFFLNHYRALGVRCFHIALNGNWSAADVGRISGSLDVNIFEQTSKIPTSQQKLDLLSRMVAGRQGEWGIFCDIDEFLEIPYRNLDRMIDAMLVLGVNSLPAYRMPRTTADGTLPDLRDDLSLDAQFPMMNFHLCEAMGVKEPVWKEKFPIAKITSNFTPQAGNHLPPNIVTNSHAPLRGVVHQFRWRGSFCKSLLQSGNFREVDTYKAYLSGSGGRVPTKNAHHASRQLLFDTGFLAKPNRDQIATNAYRRKITEGKRKRDVKSGKLAEIRRRLQSWGSTPERARLIDPVNLHNPTGKICLVGFELAGPTRTGGIGTAIAALAELLAGQGHDVHVLFCPFNKDVTLGKSWQQYWQARGVTVHYVPRSIVGAFNSTSYYQFCRILTDNLKKHHFDVIHFHDSVGYGGFACLQKAAGLAFENTQLLFTEHGSTPWHRRGNMLNWDDIEPEYDFMNKAVLEYSDLAIFPSSYIKNWSAKNSKITSNIVLPNILRVNARSYGLSRSKRKVKTICYFGRIEERKGINEFLGALEILQSEYHNSFDVKILGSFGETNKREIESKIDSIDFDIEILEYFNNIEAVNYLKFGNILAIVPSKVENLPYTVYECLENGIPVITTNVGGIPELFGPSDGASVVECTSADLANAIEKAVHNQIKHPRLAFDPAMAEIAHMALYAKMIERAQAHKFPERQADSAKMIKITYGQPPDTSESSLQKQSFGQGSWRAHPPEPQVSWQEQVNGAVLGVEGTFILFRQSRIRPSERADAALCAVMNGAGTDACVCGHSTELTDGTRFVSMAEILAPGGPGVRSPCWNIFGAGYFAISQKAFCQIGGFDPSVEDEAHAHWDLLNRLMAAGGRVVGVPDHLVHVDKTTLAQARKRIDSKFQEKLIRPWVTDMPESTSHFTRLAIANSIDRVQLFNTCTVIRIDPAVDKGENRLEDMQNQNSPENESDPAYRMMIKTMPPQLRNTNAILTAAAKEVPWYRIAIRHPLNLKYWNTVRRLQRDTTS